MTPLKLRRPRRRLLIWGAAAFFAALAAGPPVVTLLLQHPRIRKAVTTRLETSFGRPVEVGHFSVSLLGGLRVEANGVTVAEDARFGADFFLRAEQITASLRWPSLLRGRLEFGRLSIYRPSLNLVRNSAGEWNLLAWLPSPAVRGAPPAPPGPQIAVPRLYRIDVDAGRINFKQGLDQHPFALVEVSGSFAQSGGGAWHLDLEAQPLRAGVITQEPGLLRVRGQIGGPTSRIQPAGLTLTWSDVSLPDALRLLRGRDFGVRGGLAIELHTQTSGVGQPWSLAGSALLAAVHRWDLPPRASDPSVNLRWHGLWSPRDSRVEIAGAALEAPNSNIRVTGMLDWSGAGRRASHLRVASSGISLGDLFAWYRAFRPGVVAVAGVAGNAALEAEWRGWPLHLEQLVMATDGARISIPSLEAPVTLSRTAIRMPRPGARIELQPATLTFAAEGAGSAARSPGTLRVESSLHPAAGWRLQWSVTGQTPRAQEWLAAAAALGFSPVNAWATAGWQAQGAASLKLRGQGALWPFDAPATGGLDLRNGELRAPFFPVALRFAEAKLDVDAGGRRLRLVGAQGFGSRWNGALRSPGAGRPWEVELAGDRLDAPEFDRWLGAPGEQADPLQRALREVAASTRGALPGPRLRGSVALSPRLVWPLLGPLRAEDVMLDLLLTSPALGRKPLRVAGTIAAVRIAPLEPATER